MSLIFKAFRLLLLAATVLGSSCHVSKAQTTSNLVYDWSRSLQSTTVVGGFTETKSLAMDGSGNLYITGTFSGTADFDPSIAQQNLVSNGGLDLFFAKYNSGGSLVFAYNLGGTSDDAGLSIKADAAGNVYLSGYFQGSMDFDPSASTAQLISGGNKDLFIAKYTSTGNYVFAKCIGSTGLDEGKSLAIDNTGAIYLTGVFTGTVDFDPSSLNVVNLNSAGGTDIFIAKYDAVGNYVYAKAFGGNGQDNGNAIAIDTARCVYITGSFESGANFDPTSSSGYLGSAGSSDIFIAKYNNIGNYVYAKSIGSNGLDKASSIVADTSGIIYITGSYEGSVDFDPSSGVASLSSVSSSKDIFIAKYSSSGSYVYAKTMGGSATDISNSIFIDANKSVYITGAFQGVANFNPPSSASSFTSQSTQDIFFAKYDASGTHVFAKVFQGSYYSSEGKGICVDASNQIYVGGYFSTRVDFDPSSSLNYLNANNIAANYRDAFLGKYSSTGTYSWAVQFGTHFDSQFADIRDMKKDNVGNIFVVGLFRGEFDFDPSPSTYLLKSNSFSDMFIAKYTASGNFVFAKRFKTFGVVIPGSLALDANKNIYVAGTFDYEMDFDGNASTPPHVTDQFDRDLFYAKYDSTGAYLDVKQFYSDLNGIISTILVNGSGEVYITGGMGYADFDPSSAFAWVTSSGFSDIFIAKYDASGNYVYAKKVGSSAGQDVASSMVMDANGQLYLTGYFTGTVDFDPSTSTYNLISSGSIDAFIARYTSSGSLVYAKAIGGGSADAGNCITIDGVKSVYITGQYNGTIDFNPAPTGYAFSTSLGLSDAYIAKYDSVGNYVYSKSLGGVQGESGVVIKVDNSGSVLVAGEFWGLGDYDPGIGVANLSNVGSNDLFIAKYDAAGNYMFAKVLGSPGYETALNMCTNSAGSEIYVTAAFYGQLDADPNAGTVILDAGLGAVPFIIKYNSCTGPAAPVNTSSSPNQYLCSGSTTSLTVSGTGTISWYPSLSSTLALTTGTAYVTPTLSAGTHTLFVETYSTCNIGLRTEITVTVNPTPTISVTNSLNLCTGNSYTIQPTGADTYSISGASFVVSPVNNTTYSVTGSSSLGCASSNTAILSIVVQPLPTLTIANGLICSGNSFTLQPSGGSTYTFSSGTPVVTPGSTTNYSVYGISQFGCPSTNTAIATVSVVSSPSVSVNSGTLCSGNVFSLSPSGALTYSISGGAFQVTPLVSQNYTIVGYAANGCSNTAVSSLTVKPLPVISIPSASICAGDSFTLAPTGAFSYTISGGQFVVSPSISTTYSVNGTSNDGCLSQGYAVSVVTVVPLPLVSVSGGSICSGNGFTLQPSGANSYTYSGAGQVVFPVQTTTYGVIGMSNGCLSSNTAVATVTVLATPTVSVNSGSICAGSSFVLLPSGATNYTFSSGTSSVTPAVSSNYTITGESNGCVNSAISNVTVHPNPTISVNSGSICSGGTFTLTPSGAASYVFTGGTSVVSPSVTTNYTVSGLSSEGCNSQNMAISTVLVYSVPIIAAGNGSICAGSSFTLTPSGGSTYSFSSGTNIVSPATNSTYSIVGFSAEGCASSNTVLSQVTVYTVPVITVNNGAICAGSTFTLMPQGGSSYTFAGGQSVVSPVTTSAYVVFGSNSHSCVSSATSVVTVNPLPIITVNSGSICVGDSFVILVSGAQSYTYSSSSNTVTPIVNTNYSVTGTDNNGCLSAYPGISSVTVNPLPMVAVADGSICSGQIYTLQPTGASSYSCSGGSFTVNPITDSNYTITGVSLAGCSNTALATVSVGTLPIITCNGGSVCAGNSFTILPSGGISYTFSSGSSIVTPQTSGSYTVFGSGPNNCINTAVSLVTVNPLPVLNLNSSHPVICETDSIEVILTTSGALYYLWNTGENSASITINPTTTTVYTVSGTDLQGCTSTQTISQIVDACTGINNSTFTQMDRVFVYPNPNSGQFFVEVAQEANVFIYSSVGQVFHCQKLLVGINVLELKNVAKGIYFIRVITENKVIERKVLVQ